MNKGVLTMKKLPDEIIEHVADKYRELGMHKTGVTFYEYLMVWAEYHNY